MPRWPPDVIRAARVAATVTISCPPDLDSLAASSSEIGRLPPATSSGLVLLPMLPEWFGMKQHVREVEPTELLHQSEVRKVKSATGLSHRKLMKSAYVPPNGLPLTSRTDAMSAHHVYLPC
jgi:hypothetical protein